MEDEKIESHNRICFVDMDGVIANFDRGVLELTGFTLDQQTEEEMWKKINEYGKSKFFTELHWTIGGKQLWYYVTNHFIHVKILSALGSNDKIDKKTTVGKMGWLNRNIPSLREDDIILVSNKHKKHHYSKSENIIIDDNNVVIEEWVRKGGIGILYRNTLDTISKLKEYV